MLYISEGLIREAIDRQSRPSIKAGAVLGAPKGRLTEVELLLASTEAQRD